MPRVDTARINRLVADLDSDDFFVRNQASRALEQLAEIAEAALTKALEATPSLEVRRQAERLLRRLEQPLTSPELLRALRFGRGARADRQSARKAAVSGFSQGGVQRQVYQRGASFFKPPGSNEAQTLGVVFGNNGFRERQKVDVFFNPSIFQGVPSCFSCRGPNCCIGG